MPNLSITGYKTKRNKLARRKREFETRRARLIAQSDNLAGAIDQISRELEAVEAVIQAIESHQSLLKTRPSRTRTKRGARNKELDDAIVRHVTAAGEAGISKDDLYDAIDAESIALPARKSFAVHLSYFGKDGPIVARQSGGQSRWILRELAPPLPPPAISEALRLIAAAPDGLTRPEIERQLALAQVPYTAKSLLTQLGYRVRDGKLTLRDNRYRQAATNGDAT